MEGQQPVYVKPICQNDKCNATLKFPVTGLGIRRITCPVCKMSQIISLEQSPDGQVVVVPKGLMIPGAPKPQFPQQQQQQQQQQPFKQPQQQPQPQQQQPWQQQQQQPFQQQSQQQPWQQQQPQQQPFQQQQPQQQPFHQQPQQQQQPFQQQQQQQPKQPQQQGGAPQFLPIDVEVIVGKETQLECPHCHKTLKIKAPKEGEIKFQCGACKGGVSVKAVSKTIVFPMTPKPSSAKRGHLVKVNGFLKKNEIFRLRDGKNVIGRFDNSQQSDIAIMGDSSMSRRSVEIEVVPTGNGYQFKFTILKSLNPVVYNNQKCTAPYSREIKFGDQFVLGSTLFRFEADN